MSYQQESLDRPCTSSTCMHLQLVLFQFVFMPETLRTNITREDLIVSEAVHKPQMIVPVAFVGERLAAGVAAVGGALAAVDGLQV